MIMQCDRLEFTNMYQQQRTVIFQYPTNCKMDAGPVWLEAVIEHLYGHYKCA